MIPPLYATCMWSKDSNVCVEKFLGQQIYLSIFSTVNLNISICLPSSKRERWNSEHLMSISTSSSFQQIAYFDQGRSPQIEETKMKSNQF